MKKIMRVEESMKEVRVLYNDNTWKHYEHKKIDNRTLEICVPKEVDDYMFDCDDCYGYTDCDGYHITVYRNY